MLQSSQEGLIHTAQVFVITSYSIHYTKLYENKAYGLRVAPPTIMHGEQVHISAPSYKTFSALAETDFGDILINVGFQRGDDHWM